MSDRITLTWSASDEVAAAVREHAASIAEQVLATMINERLPEPDWHRDDDLDLAFMITVAG